MPGKVNKTRPAFIQTAADAKRAMKDIEQRVNLTIAETEDATEEGLKEIRTTNLRPKPTSCSHRHRRIEAFRLRGDRYDP